jgi:hypothetical protein
VDYFERDDFAPSVMTPPLGQNCEGRRQNLCTADIDFYAMEYLA